MPFVILKFFFALILMGFTTHLFGNEQYAELKRCLMTSYGVDEEHVESILSKFTSPLDNIDFHYAADNFIDRSHHLNINFKDTPQSSLLPDDAVLLVPQWHEVLFESPFVRILWACSKPGDREPFHTHQWKSLLWIIQGAEFDIEYADGTHEKGFWPIGIYDLPPDSSPAAYINRGPCDFLSLRFELKDLK